MKVSELIEMLNKMNPDFQIIIKNEHGHAMASSVIEYIKVKDELNDLFVAVLLNEDGSKPLINWASECEPYLGEIQECSGLVEIF